MSSRIPKGVQHANRIGYTVEAENAILPSQSAQRLKSRNKSTQITLGRLLCAFKTFYGRPFGTSANICGAVLPYPKYCVGAALTTR